MDGYDIIEEIHKERILMKIKYSVIDNISNIKKIQIEALDDILNNDNCILIKSRQMGMTTLLRHICNAYEENGLNHLYITPHTPKLGGLKGLSEKIYDIIIVDEWVYCNKLYNKDFKRMLPKSKKYILSSSVKTPTGLISDLYHNRVTYPNMFIKKYVVEPLFDIVDYPKIFGDSYLCEYLCEI